MTFIDEEFCPYGSPSRFPENKPEFDIDTPPNTNPNNVVPGKSIPVSQGDTIMITMATNPEVFYLMDLQYEATVKTRVILEDENGNENFMNVSHFSDIF